MWHLMTLYFKIFSTFFHPNSVLTSNYQRSWYRLQRSSYEKAFRRSVHISNMFKEVLKHFLSKLAQQMVHSDRLRYLLHNKAQVFLNQVDAKLLSPLQDILRNGPDQARLGHLDHVLLPPAITASHQPIRFRYLRAHFEKVLLTEPS